MISFRDWVIQFREEEGDIGSVGATFYDDGLDMNVLNPDYDSESSLRDWLTDNFHCNRQMRAKILHAYRQYRIKIQGEDRL